MTKKRIQIIRNSERKDFLRCPQRWDWAWNDGLRPQTGTRLPFWFGTGVHEALAFWYGPEGTERGPDLRETWSNYCAREKWSLDGRYRDDEEQFQEIVDLGLAMFRGYVAQYGDDPHIQVIVPERDFAVLIRRPDGVKVRVVGTFDLIYYDKRTGKLWLGEHKTAKRIQIGHLPTDNQAGVYFSVATHVAREEGFIGKKDKLAGINYNFLRKAAPDPDADYDYEGYLLNKPLKTDYAAQLVTLPEFEDVEVAKLANKYKKDDLAAMAAKNNLRVQGERAAAQPAAYFLREAVRRTTAERKRILQRLGQEAMWMEAATSGSLPILKNYTTDCEWDCDFYWMCQAHEKGDDWEGLRDAVFSTTDPYKDHRKAA